MLLVKEGGYSLDAINGSEAVVERERPPTAAELFSDALPGRARPAAGAVALCIAAVASVSPPLALAALVLLSGLAAMRLARADGDPRRAREKWSSPGMGEKEVWRRLVALDELIQMRNEETEGEADKAARQQGSLPGA